MQTKETLKKSARLGEIGKKLASNCGAVFTGLVVLSGVAHCGATHIERHPVNVESRIESLAIRVDELEIKIQALEKQHKSDVELLKKSIVAKKLTVTAYSGSISECDDDPNVTASMTELRPGIIAVSRDLFKQGWVFGRKVYIEGVGIYEIADLMNSKHKNRIDVYIGHKKKAVKFGKKDLVVALLPDSKS